MSATFSCDSDFCYHISESFWILNILIVYFVNRFLVLIIYEFDVYIESYIYTEGTGWLNELGR